MTGETLRALLAMLVTQAAVVMAAYTAPVLGKQITGALAVSPALVGYYTSVIFAAAMAASLLSGALIQSHGSVRISQATVILAAAGLVCLAAGNAVAVLASAILIGFAYGPGNPASSQLLMRVTPPQHRNTIFSLKQTAVPLGVASAGLAVPFLIGFVSWQAALLIMVGVFAALAVAVEGWRAPLDAHRQANGAKPAPFASLRLVFEMPALRRLGIVSLALASVQFAFSAIFVTYLQEARQASTVLAGSLLSTAMVISVVSRVLLGATADRLGGRRMLFAMSILMAAAAIVLTASAEASLLTIAITGVILGATSFSWNGVYLAEVASAAPRDAVAVATAGTMFFVFLGGFIGPALVSTSISAAGSYEAGFAVLAALAAFGAVILKLPERIFSPAAAS